MQLPYINLPQSRAPEIIGDMGNTLIEAAQRKQQQEQQAIQNLMQQQRLEAEQARMRAEENRAQAEEHRAAAANAREEHRHAAQLAEATASALPQIHQALAAGDTGSAEAMAQAHGIRMQQRPLAMAPGGAPGAPQAPAEQGPIPSPEERALSFAGQTGDQAGAAEQAISDDQRMLGERQQYAQALADHPRLVAEHQAHQAAYQQAKQNPIYDIETPYGKTTFDLGAERQHQQAQQQETAGNLAQGLPPQYALRAAALIKTGLPPQEVSREIQAQMRTDEDRAARSDLAGGRNQTALQVAALRKRASKGEGGSAAQAGLAELIKMKEDGAADSAIAAKAAELRIPPKVWTGPIKEVVRGAAIGQRVEQKKEALQVTGPNGESGIAHSVKDAAELNKKNQAFDQMKVRLQAAIDDIKQNGTRVMSDDAIQRRNSLMSSAAAAGRVYNGLGGTDASQRLESEINSAAGTPMHGFIMGANPDVLMHNMQEAERAHETALQVRTKAGSRTPAAAQNKPPVIHTPDGKAWHLQPDGSYQ
jgi:hypothetical protein